MEKLQNLKIYLLFLIPFVYMYEYTINMMIKQVNRVVESSIRFQMIL